MRPGAGRVAAPPIASHILGEGHAWVASGYRARTVAAGTDHLLVQRVMRAGSHCGFHGETREQAFELYID